MIRLAWRLLPYAMVLGGGFLILGTLPAIFGQQEKEPTIVQIDQLADNTPTQRWLTIEGGGAFLPDVVIDQKINTETDVTTDKAYYVPWLSEAGAIERGFEIITPDATRSKHRHLVLVKYRPNDFKAAFPSSEDLSPENLHMIQPITGTKSASVLFSSRLKDYIQSDLGLDIDQVLVLKAGAEPLQRGGAIQVAVFMLAVIAIGIFWIFKRWTRPRQPQNTPQAQVTT